MILYSFNINNIVYFKMQYIKGKSQIRLNLVSLEPERQNMKHCFLLRDANTWRAHLNTIKLPRFLIKLRSILSSQDVQPTTSRPVIRFSWLDCVYSLEPRCPTHEAYDRVSREFLDYALARKGFSSRWRNWIFEGISLMNFFVRTNGSPHVFFHLGKS